MSAKKAAPPDQPDSPDNPDAPTGEAVAIPTIGRTVLYVNEEGDTYPAVVSAVTDESLHLTVFDAVAGPRLYCVAIGHSGSENGQWSWPPRA